jgi:hypothetical protein
MIVLKKIGSGKYSDIFSVTIEDSSFAMKVSYYREETVVEFTKKMREGDENGAKKIKDSDAISVSAKFARITRQMKKLNITPHFIHIFDTRDVKNFVEKIPILSSRFDRLSPFQQKYNHVTFMELFETDLTAFITKSESCDDSFLRTCIFRVLYTIAVTQRLVPGWRHNDLSTNNVLTKKSEERPARYEVDGDFFYVISSRSIAIIDYDFVNAAANTLRNHRVHSGDFKVLADDNVSYDSHFFLKSVQKCLEKRQNKPRITLSFLKSLRLKQNDRQDSEIPHLNPLDILKHSYFKPLTAPIPVVDFYKIAIL